VEGERKGKAGTIAADEREQKRRRKRRGQERKEG